ncbi:uncharacterized protein [Henckelia pumila]|uniref:uncharacterized protein n=1 Tax=Henckelia pumila TaxID=405737 RepID=UPI003C6DC3E2
MAGGSLKRKRGAAESFLEGKVKWREKWWRRMSVAARSMVDAASGGVFVDKTPRDARNLIENMAVNSQEWTKCEGLWNLHARRHATNMFPTLQEETVEQVNASGGFPRPPQRNYDPYSNTYNPGWKDHSNLRYGNPLMNQSASQVHPNNKAYRPPYPPQPQSPQIPTLEAQNSSSLPSQTLPNPKENVSGVTLQSVKELKVREEVVQAPVQNEDEEESRKNENEPIQRDISKVKFPPLSEYKPVGPSSLALKESRKGEGIKEFYDTFRRCGGCQKVELGEQVSAVIQRKTPAKCKDPVPLNENTIFIQMADRSTIYPRGVLEDVLMKVSETSQNFLHIKQKENPWEKADVIKRRGPTRKSKERKHGPKFTVKMLKWVKVDKVIIYEPP